MTSYPFRLASAAVALGGAVALPPPAMAQSAPPQLVIYGDQKCPTNADGDEIVVCVRRGQEEQFRIPKELRELKVTPENESWAARSAPLDQAGASGIGSCSNSGPGGASGCFLQQAEETRRFNKARKDADRQVQESLP